MVDTAARDEVFDVAVVGAGPAGLATAVYAASEGPDAWWCWTAAPTAARPAPARASRTTWAFPTGISGQALAGRAYVQAQKFGAEMLIPAQAVALDCRARRRRGVLASS